MRPKITHDRRPRSKTADLQTARPGEKGPSLPYELPARIAGLPRRPASRLSKHDRKVALAGALGNWLQTRLDAPDDSPAAVADLPERPDSRLEKHDRKLALADALANWLETQRSAPDTHRPVERVATQDNPAPWPMPATDAPMGETPFGPRRAIKP